VRLPRQPGGSITIEKESRWLPVVGPFLPVEVPSIVALGEPGFGYPERWSVVRWIPGDVPPFVAPEAPADPTRISLALDLAAVITALGDIDVPGEALHDPALRSCRGDPVATRDTATRLGIKACRALPDLALDLDAALRVWDQAMTAPGPDPAEPPRWYHGDLVDENLLVQGGRLGAVLDFGELSIGDPTVDLVVAWSVLDAPAREAFRTALDLDDAVWLRGRAWALSLAILTFPYYWETMPARCASSLAMARAVLDDGARR
jgi:aminoglycoside phosphotransferase (APT) family kinase protein